MIGRRLSIFGAVLLSPGLAIAGGLKTDSCSSFSGMTWVKKECHFLPLLAGDPQIARSPKDLPPEIASKLEEHLVQRLGRPFFSKLRFDEAHINELESFYLQVPSWDREKIPMPTYEVAYQVTISTEGPVEYCAKIELDASGVVLEEIDLPAVARDHKLGEVVPPQDILNLASSLGVPKDEASLDMEYNPRQGYFEYLVSYLPKETPLEVDRILLYVRAHDPREYFWSFLEFYERPTPLSNATGAPAG